MRARLGQHFLFDPKALSRIVRAAGISPDDTVVEIGPGLGGLTRLLAGRAARVVAIELDRVLYERLRESLGDHGNIELVRGDALRFPYGGLGPFKVVANIPYHITTPIIFRLLEFRESLRSMTLTVQKEVAERVSAAPGGKDYGVLSLTVQYHGRAELKFVIPRRFFRPVPRVDSACLHIDVLRRPSVEVADEALFFEIIRAAFSQRRKTLRNSLRKLLPRADAVLGAVGIDPSLRAEKLGIGEFAKLANEALRTSGKDYSGSSNNSP
jgi:16S rRNA (adenine1518-N6/adenine1519-N6)-dimethyltransferase